MGTELTRTEETSKSDGNAPIASSAINTEVSCTPEREKSSSRSHRSKSSSSSSKKHKHSKKSRNSNRSSTCSDDANLSETTALSLEHKDKCKIEKVDKSERRRSKSKSSSKKHRHSKESKESRKKKKKRGVEEVVLSCPTEPNISNIDGDLSKQHITDALNDRSETRADSVPQNPSECVVVQSTVFVSSGGVETTSAADSSPDDVTAGSSITADPISFTGGTASVTMTCSNSISNDCNMGSDIPSNGAKAEQIPESISKDSETTGDECKHDRSTDTLKVDPVIENSSQQPGLVLEALVGSYKKADDSVCGMSAEVAKDVAMSDSVSECSHKCSVSMCQTVELCDTVATEPLTARDNGQLTEADLRSKDTALAMGSLLDLVCAKINGDSHTSGDSVSLNDLGDSVVATISSCSDEQAGKNSAETARNADNSTDHSVETEKFTSISERLADSVVNINSADLDDKSTAAEADMIAGDEISDCLRLPEKLLIELETAVGKAVVTTPQFDYSLYRPKDVDFSSEDYGRLVEIYDFPVGMITRDLLVAFRPFRDRYFDIRWVDCTHAIGIFSETHTAMRALAHFSDPQIKIQPISFASSQTKAAVRKCADLLLPIKERPDTSLCAAKNMLAGALNMHGMVSQEQRREDRRLMREARDRKRAPTKSSRPADSWDGKVRPCAMDFE